MSFIRSWMHRDAIRTKALDIQRCFNEIRVVAPTAVAQGGNFVDVY